MKSRETSRIVQGAVGDKLYLVDEGLNVRVMFYHQRMSTTGYYLLSLVFLALVYLGNDLIRSMAVPIASAGMVMIGSDFLTLLLVSLMFKHLYHQYFLHAQPIILAEAELPQLLAAMQKEFKAIISVGGVAVLLVPLTVYGWLATANAVLILLNLTAAVIVGSLVATRPSLLHHVIGKLTAQMHGAQ